MSFLSQSSGRITASQSSTASTLSFKKTAPRLYQSSLHDFMKRKPKTKQTQNENRHIGAISRFTKGQRSNSADHQRVAKKKRKTCQEASRTDSEHILIDSPSKSSQELRGSRPRRHNLLPSAVHNVQDMVSEDDSTLTDITTSSCTLRTDSSASLPCSPKKGLTAEKGDNIWTRDISGLLSATHDLTTQPSYQRVLAPDTPLRIKTFPTSENKPSAVSPLRSDISKQTGDCMEVIPSSQTQELAAPPAENLNRTFLVPSSHVFDVHFPSSVDGCSHINWPTEGMSDEFVPSSQSQYLLPYNMSPRRPSLLMHRGGDSATTRADVVPSSQILGELELSPSTCHPALPTTGTIERRIPSSLGPVASPSNLREIQTPSTPHRQPPSTSTTMQSPARSVVVAHTSPSPPHQAEIFSPVIISTSPPPLASSQYSYLSSNASFPPEVKNFLSMFDDDRHSLGSDFHDGSLGQPMECEDSRDGGTLTAAALSESTPTPNHRTVSPEPLSESCSPPGSISTQSIIDGYEAGYTFVEESCPRVVTEFLAMLHQDRSSLGSQFQDTI